MAKSRNRYISAQDYAGRLREKAKNKRLKAKNPKKYKRRKQIDKFSADGKITKKEGRKLAKKGVSLSKIRNRNISNYKRAQKAAGRISGRANEGVSRQERVDSVRFEPLKIKRGAAEATRGNSGRKDRRPKPTRRNNNRNRGGGGGPEIKNDYKDRADEMLKDIDKEMDNITEGNTVADEATEVLDTIKDQTPSTIYDKSTRTDGKDLQLSAADASRKRGTKAFKRRRNSRAARRRRQMRINKSLNL